MSPPQIVSGGQECILPASHTLAAAFSTDESITYILGALTPHQRSKYRPAFFKAICTAAVLNGGIIDGVNDWQSVGILMPPDSDVGALTTLVPAGFLGVAWAIGVGGVQRMMLEIPRHGAEFKSKALVKGERYYYIFFLGTREEGRGKGLCSAVVRKYQDIAKRDGLPLYMEATEAGHGLYMKLGFTNVGKAVVGEGKANADGTLGEGGPGFALYGMVWRPEESNF